LQPASQDFHAPAFGSRTRDEENPIMEAVVGQCAQGILETLVRDQAGSKESNTLRAPIQRCDGRGLDRRLHFHHNIRLDDYPAAVPCEQPRNVIILRKN
jgi:hypothetical protein